MKYILLLTICTVIIVASCFSQGQNKRDSLLAALSAANADSTKINVLLELGDKYERNTPDSAIYFYKQVQTLALKNKDTISLLRFFAGYTSVLDIKNQYKEALALNQQSIMLANKINSPYRLAAAYNNTARDYYYLGDYKTCTDYFLKAAAVFEKMNDKKIQKDLASLYANISGIFSEINQFEKSYAYGLKAISMSRELNRLDILARSLENTGSVLLRMHKTDSCLLLYSQAKKIGLQLNDQFTIEVTSLDMADTYLGLERYAEMKQNAEDALAASKKLEDYDGVNKAYGYLAEYYFNNKNYTEAKNYVMQALQVMKDNDITNHMQEQYLLLGEIELALGNIKGYHTNKAISDSIKESTLSAELLKNSQDLEAKYSLDKKQWQIDNLTKEHKSQQLIIKQRNTINRVLAVAILIALAAGFLYYRNAKQKNKLLAAQAEIKQQRINELETEKQLLAAESVVQGQEEERERLAKDLHDGLGGILSSVKYSFSNMKKNFIITDEGAESFDRGMVMLDKSITELRRVAHNMMPEALVNFGLNSALKDFCLGINQSGALQITYQAYNLDDDSVPKNKASVIYRIIQELVNNTLKHAEAKTMLVQLVIKDGSLSVTVEDDGKGFDLDGLKTSTGIGVINLKNRVAYLGGNIDIQTAPGQGTSVNIEIANIAIV